jgi:hypothetical protein
MLTSLSVLWQSLRLARPLSPRLGPLLWLPLGLPRSRLLARPLWLRLALRQVSYNHIPPNDNSNSTLPTST